MREEFLEEDIPGQKLHRWTVEYGLSWQRSNPEKDHEQDAAWVRVFLAIR